MKTYSRHKIYDNFDIPFSPENYSKFKFGDKYVARKFGFDLAQGFWQELMNIRKLPSKQIVVISSPYCFIPTATFAMKDYFVQKLNMLLIEQGLLPVEETKIHRTITYKEDYGALSAEERMKLIGKDGFHIDKEFVKGKLLLFLDDIIITGSHEKVIRRMLEQYGIEEECMFLYYGELANKDIHPNIENYLNYAFVKDLSSLDTIIGDQDRGFLFNTRTVKYILNSDNQEFKDFMNKQTLQFLHSLYHLAIGNSYHLIDDYKENFQTLKKHLIL